MTSQKQMAVLAGFFLMAACGTERDTASLESEDDVSSTELALLQEDAEGQIDPNGVRRRVLEALRLRPRDPTPKPDCRRNGCLRSFVYVGSFPRADIQAAVDWYNVPGSLLVDNGYSVYTAVYYSAGREVRATINVPFDAALPANGFHIVVNNHGTTGVADACGYTGKVSGSGLAGTFAGRGVIGVSPDYAGLGTAGTHPYLVAPSEGRSALDAIRAASQLARYLQVPLSGRSAMVGISQGGHATLAAAQRHFWYAPELDIRLFSTVAPASVWEEQWRAGINVDGEHIATHAMLMWAWSKHYGYRGPSIWAPALAPQIDAIMETNCNVDFFDGNPTLAAVLGTQADAIFSPEFLASYRTGKWGRFKAFARYFAHNRMGERFIQTAPLRIYQGDWDVIVYQYWTDLLVNQLREKGIDVAYEVVPGAGHIDLAFGFVVEAQYRTQQAIAEVKAHLDN